MIITYTHHPLTQVVVNLCICSYVALSKYIITEQFSLCNICDSDYIDVDDDDVCGYWWWWKNGDGNVHFLGILHFNIITNTGQFVISYTQSIYWLRFSVIVFFIFSKLFILLLFLLQYVVFFSYLSSLLKHVCTNNIPSQ